mmetsp:Transcript_69497/g.137447  ORF Transcript_69497/g.137447 Transcript_69497/m.137447 type:complete len:613 (-) Transcript_69497:142-1980(-)
MESSTAASTAALIEAIKYGNDAASLCWSAACLRSRLAELSAWPDELPCFVGAADGVADCLQRLAQTPPTTFTHEAASELVAALAEIARHRSCDHTATRSRLLVQPKSSGESDGLLQAILQFMREGTDIGDSGDMTFVNCCDLLSTLAAGDQELCEALRAAGVLELVSGRLLRAANGRCGVPTIGICALEATPVAAMQEGWHFFATAGVCLLEVVLLEEDPAALQAGVPSSHRPTWEVGGQPRQSQVILDAVVATLSRSLFHEGGSIVVQPMHLAGLRALGQLVRLFRGQVFLSSGLHKATRWQMEPTAGHLVFSGTPALAARILDIARRPDEQGTAVSLWFLAELAEQPPVDRAVPINEWLVEIGALAKASQASAEYPQSCIVSREAERVLRACGYVGEQELDRRKTQRPSDAIAALLSQSLLPRRIFPGCTLASAALQHTEGRHWSHSEPGCNAEPVPHPPRQCQVPSAEPPRPCAPRHVPSVGLHMAVSSGGSPATSVTAAEPLTPATPRRVRPGRALSAGPDSAPSDCTSLEDGNLCEWRGPSHEVVLRLPPVQPAFHSHIARAISWGSAALPIVGELWPQGRRHHRSMDRGIRAPPSQHHSSRSPFRD